ncbi:hypothetical protein VTL71DRAFT_10354 [Oculimacula yallundae]|uniref:2EXR domain-containing protein n=1 Tax=Oculimacula yallundae TaxID=86028 RepID=A0ABR4CT46_9HELO
MPSPQSSYHLVSDNLRSRAGVMEGETACRKRIGDSIGTEIQAKKIRVILEDEEAHSDSEKTSEQSEILDLKISGPRLQEVIQRKEEKRKRQTLMKTGAERMDPSYHGPVFHLFTLLPTDIRLQIWTLMNPEPATLLQSKGLGYRPLATFIEPRPTPAVLHICRESRNEYLYREDDDANQVTTRGHNLYKRCFQDTEDKMNFISFEADQVFLFSFKTAEKVARDNIKTIVIGPQRRFKDDHWAKLRQRYGHRHGWRRLPPHKLAPATYLDDRCGCSYQRLWKNQEQDPRNFVYDFKDLRHFPSLEKLVIRVEDEVYEDELDMQATKKVIAVAISTAQASFPAIKTPAIEWSVFESEHTCGGV